MYKAILMNLYTPFRAQTSMRHSVYIFRKMHCRLIYTFTRFFHSFPAYVPDKYSSIIYLSLEQNMYSGKHLHILVI